MSHPLATHDLQYANVGDPGGFGDLAEAESVGVGCTDRVDPFGVGTRTPRCGAANTGQRWIGWHLAVLLRVAHRLPQIIHCRQPGLHLLRAGSPCPHLARVPLIAVAVKLGDVRKPFATVFAAIYVVIGSACHPIPLVDVHAVRILTGRGLVKG